MPLKSSNDTPASLARAESSELTEIIYSFRFITPMFGGGVEVNGPSKPFDPRTPIRVPSIRGQLRFWWRACNFPRATTIEQLRDAEAKVWGSTSRPSAVSIRVVGRPPSPQRIAVFKEGKKPGRWVPLGEHSRIAYALFPLKPPENSKEGPGVLWRFSDAPITISLSLRLSKETSESVDEATERAKKSLDEALRAWSLFGGLGGRTRRGFGAIESVMPHETTMEKLLQSLNERPRIPGVPSLCGARVAFAGNRDTGKDAWYDAVSALQRFRQGPGKGRGPANPQTGRPGRSFWPEADEIRRQTGSHSRMHAPVSAVAKFPRAPFGLPIIFHFSTYGDPNDATLTPADGLNRFASPLILRPVKNSDGKYRPMALVLANTSPPATLTLSGKTAANAPFSASVAWRLQPGEAQQIRPLSGSIDPLQSFLRDFSKK